MANSTACRWLFAITPVQVLALCITMEEKHVAINYYWNWILHVNAKFHCLRKTIQMGRLLNFIASDPAATIPSDILSASSLIVVR